tara:strand:+ start:368 stop:739 length:372 start_codon:yes stop_codon:yes gene_type:complete
MKFYFNYLIILLFSVFILYSKTSIAKEENYTCHPKHAAAIRSNGIKVFKITGKEKPVIVAIKDGYFKTNDMSYKLYDAGGRAFAFNKERAWVHFQDITVLDDDTLSFVMAVNSSISRYLCKKK